MWAYDCLQVNSKALVTTGLTAIGGKMAKPVQDNVGLPHEILSLQTARGSCRAKMFLYVFFILQACCGQQIVANTHMTRKGQ